MEDQSNAQPIVELHTATDYETTKAFFLAKDRWLRWGVSVFLAAWAMAANVYACIDCNTFILCMGGICLLLGFVFYLLFAGISVLNAKTAFYRINQDQACGVFRLYSDCVAYEGRDAHGEGASTCNYSAFASACEHSAFFELTQRNGSSFVFAKNDLVGYEQVETIRALFAEKYGKKFKQHKR